MKFKQNLKALKKNWQIIYSIGMIVLVPIVIVLNTFITTSAYNTSIDGMVQRQANNISQVFVGAVLDDSRSETDLQSALNRIGENVEDLRFAEVLIPDGEHFRVVASLNSERIGYITKAPNDTTAVVSWHNKQIIALQTNLAAIFLDDPLATRQGDLTEQFYDVYAPIVDGEEKIALLNFKISRAVVDQLRDNSLKRSLIVLVISMIVVLLAMMSNTRIFQYALLAKKLKEVEQLKDEFISMASHELRTPITSLKGYLSMMADGSLGELPELAHEKVKMMLGSSERLAGLVEDLLNVSRIEQGRLEIGFEKADIVPVVEGVMSELQVQADNKRLKFTFEKDENLPQLLIDPNRCKQIFVNIFGNSIKYTPKGSVTISAKIVNDGKHVEVRCSDTGMGMTQKERAQLFQKFYRVKSNKADKIVGTGLGLWITKQLIELQDGEIQVDSIKGVGTQMAITFPIYTEKEMDARLAKQAAKNEKEADKKTPKNPYPPSDSKVSIRE